MSMTRYSPFESLLPLALRDSALWGPDLFGFGYNLPVDVAETEKGFIIEASLPGVKPEDLKVTATSMAITIRATAGHAIDQEAKEVEKKAASYVRHERYSGVMTRVIELPEAINPARIKAAYKHGLLTIEAPKVGEAESTAITVKVDE
ncbi:MAG TPA: Hsp20/alpha crystallin family protein [Ktedonobacterales bacterium]